MGDEDEDYLSDKFLVETVSEHAPKTYAEIRKEARKKSQLKNEQNRVKSRRQREIEAREEGLNKSLFERAKEEEEAGLSSGNKALAMMMKMGFKPGESLGRTSQPAESTVPETIVEEKATTNDVPPSETHKKEPLPIQEWLGKSGIGVAKRARSPSANERLAKMAKLEEEASHRTFRDRARQEYEERRAESRLVPAQRTCNTLDEKAGKTLNVLWLNPNQPETFPPGLMEALSRHHEQYMILSARSGETEEERLRRQMQADALTASSSLETGSEDEIEDGSTAKEKQKLVELNQQYDPDFLEEAVQFLRLEPQDRLHLVVSYLRTTYAYCFWCGTEYQDQNEMAEQCPGSEEDDHD